jgi:predicted glycoside hydrolase/deacetylase ChbG (UPF0249 family)
MRGIKSLLPAVIILTCIGAIAQSALPQTAADLGGSQVRRYLIVEAEDLGMAHSIDRASLDALEKGLDTSVAILVPAPWFSEVVRWSRHHPNADLGLQLDLNAEWASYRWRPVSVQPPNSGLLDPVGYLPNNAQYIGRHAKPEEVAAEFRAQIDAAKKAGLPITHLDTHGGVGLFTPWLFKEFWKASQDSGLPVVLSKEYVLKHGTPTGKENVYSIAGIEIDLDSVPFDRILQLEPGFAKEDWLNAYEKTLAALPPGVYMLSVHLGFNDEELQAMTVDHPNWGAQWRQNDYDVISSPEFQKFLKVQGFTLIGWKELKKTMDERKTQGPN